MLGVPESYADCILDLYPSALFGAHQGFLRRFKKIKQKYFIPHLMHYIRSVLKECQICQLHKVEPAPKRQFENRIHLNYTSMSKFNCIKGFMIDVPSVQ